MKFYLPLFLLLASPRIVPYSGGSVVSGGGGTTYTGANPITVTGSVISCDPASASQGGCLTDSTQYIAGIKIFNNVVAPQAAYALSPVATVSLENTYGMTVGDAITTTLDGQALRFVGRRANGDPGSGLTLESEHFRDAGSYFSVNSGYPCNSPIFSVSASGDVVYSAATDPDCNQGVDVLTRGVLTDGTTASGHVSMQSSENLYLTFQGRLANNHNGVLSDGGRPIADGGYWIQTESDGGAYFPYAGLHGEISLKSSSTKYGGWMFQILNSGAFGSPTKFFVDSAGGIGNQSGVSFANLPACPGWQQITSLGQYYYGAAVGTLMYAADTERWYTCTTASGWQQLGLQAPTYLPPVLVNAALTVSTLGGFVLPSSNSPMVSALNFYVGASGTGGSTSATIRLSDGTYQCDFNFACDLSTGAKRVTGTGAGCNQFGASGTYSLTVQSIGNCSVGPTLTGNVTVEALWR